MHLLVIGQSGQLARALATEASKGTFTATFLNRQVCDLSKTPDQIKAALDPHISGVDAIIIAAAYTAVDAAEDDYPTAEAVNSIAPGAISAVAATAGIPVVHISTDYVFQGDASAPYKPITPTNPLNAYGRSKAIGEQAVRSAQPNSCVLRTSWVYDGTGKNFLTTMLRLAETRDSLSVVNDQFGRPTYAQDLARASVRAARLLYEGDSQAQGLFHISNTGDPIHWAEFATAIFAAAKTGTNVTGISTSEYPTPAVRPQYSVMDTQSFETNFSMPLPHWEDGLKRALDEWKRS